MLVTIPNILDPEQLDAVRSVLRRSQFVDGKLSAGSDARQQKNNEELDCDANTLGALNNIVMTPLVQNPLYLQTALPCKIAAPIYARYTAGMGYGEHIDDPIMGPANARYRSDISITLFLNEPAEYEGGELNIQTASGSAKFKLDAGHAILYPSTSIHSVEPVTAGERLVAVSWVQSLVRQAEQRQILVQLQQAMTEIENGDLSKSRQKIDQSYTNLLRQWSDF